MPADL
jgi:hypothetical protein